GNKLVYFMAMNNVKFRRTVTPGDQLVLDIEMVNRRTKVIQIRGKAYVDGNLVAEGDFTAAVVDRQEVIVPDNGAATRQPKTPTAKVPHERS
ncbi:MAG TPA: hypothetical protein VII11_10935, partial [Bacteroidota bacterium]